MMDLSGIRDALRDVEREYRDDVRGYVKEALDEHWPDEDAARDSLWEAVDGSWWVTYTFAAQAVLMISENDGYSIDEWGGDWVVKDGAIDWSRLAFGALYADCLELFEIMAAERREDSED